MSTEQPGRPERTTADASPVGSTIAIIVALVAVVCGFFIMKTIRDNEDTTASNPTRTTVTTDLGSTTTVAGAVTTTTAFVPVYTGTKVQVANSASVAKAAGTMTTQLEGQGFDMADPTNGAAGKVELATTRVVYNPNDPNALKVAQTVASLLRVATLETSDSAIDTEDGTWPSGVGVVVLLGKDKAGKTLAEIAGGGTGTTTSSTQA